MTKTLIEMSKKTWLKPEDKIYQYVIVHHLSSGGMGEVYYSKDTMSDEFVAIKFLAQDLADDREMVQRFDTEARLLKNTNHKNIVKIRDYGQYKGVPYIVMEFVEGVPLKELIQNKLTDIQTSIEIMEQLLDAVGHIHRLNIIHRDLKPSNIIVLPDMSVKLLDFGIAKDLDEEEDLELTRVGDVIGSTQYLTPEQITEGLRTPQSDIRNLGMIFYELLTWQFAINYKNKIDLIEKIKNENIHFPEDSRVPQSLQNIILRMTDIELEKRYQSVLKVQIDLEAVEEIEYEVGDVETAWEEHTQTQIKIQELFTTVARRAEFHTIRMQGVTRTMRFGIKTYVSAIAMALLLFMYFIFFAGESKKKVVITQNQNIPPAKSSDGDPESSNDNFFEKLEEDINNTQAKDEAEAQPKKARRKIKNTYEKPKRRNRVKPKREVASNKNSKPVETKKPVVKKPVVIQPPRLRSSKQSHTLKQYNKDTLLLGWHKQNGVKKYDVEISKSKYFSILAYQKRDLTDNFVVWRPEAPGAYYWRVKAYSEDINSYKTSRNGYIELRSTRPRLSIKNFKGGRVPAQVGQSILIDWNYPGHKSEFKVQVSRRGNFSQIENSFLTTKTSASLELSDPGKYYVRVYEVDVDYKRKISPYSNVERYYVKDVSKKRTPQSRVVPKAPKLIYPNNEQELTDGSFKFNWRGSKSDTGYQIQIARKRNFDDMVLDKGLLLDSMSVNSLASGKYYWRVRSRNRSGNSSWSPTYYFIVP